MEINIQEESKTSNQNEQDEKVGFLEHKDLQWQYKSTLEKLIGRVTEKEQKKKRVAALILTFLIIGGLLILIPFVKKVTSTIPISDDLNPEAFLD